MPAHAKWPAEDVTLLKQLWANGLSGTKISECFGGRYSGKSCIGKANRLHLEPRDSTVNRSWSHRTKPQLYVAKPKPPPKPLILSDEPEPLGRPGELPDGLSCRYIFGDVQTKDWQCCAAPGFPYCQFHKQRCTTPPSPRRA